MHAQLSEDTLTFGTKSTTPERQCKAVAQNNGGVQSSSTRYQQASYQPALTAFLSTMKVYSQWGQIPNNSCAMVAYTVSQWRNVQKNEESISFNIRWAVVLAEPGGL
ncbi:hypothetical protein R3P38DRAFT_2801922 [Favolaschia claudopus]|uniref:Uncharacterized protein n=1 Tax=Favolaschia claudopus TaxID=2862362 RepID=A0AAV9ZV13_9AGAR